jgi:hypothetical protein
VAAVADNHMVVVVGPVDLAAVELAADNTATQPQMELTL